MLKVLVNSYTCCPKMGSEPGMGWNWITSLSQFCELFVITEGEYRKQIEEWLNDPTNESLAKNLHFYWNPIGKDEIESAAIRKMCWNQGDWRFYKYYKNWQKSTAEIARKLCKSEKIDILHQLNMIGFREPGYLWQVSKVIGIPFVWGPVDAKGSFPMAYASDAPFKTKCILHIKNIITKFQLAWSPRVKEASKQASVLLSASSNSVRALKQYCNVDSPLMNETGCTISNTIQNVKKNIAKESFDILWVGKFDFRKQLDLAIKIIARLNKSNVKLHILGSGNSDKYTSLAGQLNIQDNCVWHGQVSHDEVQSIMSNSDLMLFTSVAEGTPHVVLEAIANNLPVVCFDTCGQGDCVNEDIGIKIPLTTPEQSVKDFAEAIEKVYMNRSVLQKMADNCLARAQELSWENKAKTMVAKYENIVRNS